MAQLRRNAVFTALSDTIGHELVFKHYTNKVVVGRCPNKRKVRPGKQQTPKRKK